MGASKLHRFAARLRVSCRTSSESGFEVVMDGACFSLLSRGTPKLIATSHVAAYWLWPKLYPPDPSKCEEELSKAHSTAQYSLLVQLEPDLLPQALQHSRAGQRGLVGSTLPHILGGHTSLLVHPNGPVLSYRLCEESLKHHPYRDVASLQLTPEALEHFFHDVVRFDSPLKPLELRASGSPVQQGELVHVVGYDNGDEDDSVGTRHDHYLLRPFLSRGTVAVRTAQQSFFRFPETVTFGNCGAPIVDADGLCCGLVEGTVPNPSPDPLLRVGDASVVEAALLSSWLAEEGA